MPRRQARRIADELVVIARRLFDERRRTMEANGADPELSNVGSAEWLEGLRNVLTAAATRLQQPVPPSPPLEAAWHQAIGGLVEIEAEVNKVDGANSVIVGNADRLRDVYFERIRALGALTRGLNTRLNDEAFYAGLRQLDGAASPPLAAQALTQAPAAAPGASMAHPPASRASVAPAVVTVAPQAHVSGAPMFSTVSQEYIDMRIDNDGPDQKDIPYLKLRRQLFLEVIGDKPVDKYTASRTASSLNSRVNFRLSMIHLRFHYGLLPVLSTETGTVQG